MPCVKLTKSSVEPLPHPAKGQTMYRDSDLPGFYLVIGKTAKTFVAQKDIQGRTVRYTIGKYGHLSPDQARKVAKEKLYLMATGVNPNQQEQQTAASKLSLNDIFEEYLRVRHSLKERTRTDYRAMMDKYLGDWMDKRMADISKHMIAKKHAHITSNNGPYPANKVMRILRALFNHAIASHDLVPANPVSYLTQARAWHKEHRRRTYIKPNDLKDWWDGVAKLENTTYRDFLYLLLFTGLRRSEAASLKWEDIDFNNKEFTIEETKNGDPLTLPLSEFVFRMLENRRRQSGNYRYVFPGPGKKGFLAEPKKGIKKVIEASGVKFTCHDLRRTFITIAESLDIGAYALKRLINHRVTDVTGGYIIVDVERLREPITKIETLILEKIDNVCI